MKRNGYSYNPKKSNRVHLECLNKSLALHLLKYEHFLLLGDFNVCVEDSSMSEFCDTYNLKSLIREPTCYKNPENPSCIDLILTNRPCSFQNSCVFETGLSDFHRMTVTVMKMHFQKLQPRVINYRDYKHFQNENLGKICCLEQFLLRIIMMVLLVLLRHARKR